jgi:hypothetical protein
VVELEVENPDNTRFCDLYDLRDWNLYDIVFRAMPSTLDYRAVYGGLSYSLKSERHLMPTSFDHAYVHAENWIINGALPSNIKGHHKRHNLSGQYDAFEAYIDEWSGDLMTPTRPQAYERLVAAQSGLNS